MNYIYTNSSNSREVWIGDECLKPGASIEKSVRLPSFEQAVKNGVLNVEVSGSVTKPHGGLTVLFDCLGFGLPPYPVRNVVSGSTVKLPTLENPDLTFAGWFKDLERTESFTDSTPVTENITLYAKWTNSAGEVVEEDSGIENNSEAKIVLDDENPAAVSDPAAASSSTVEPSQDSDSAAGA